MTRIERIDINRLHFTTVPDRRVAEITAALDAQRANRRTAPAGSIDEDTAARNVVDLEGVLERAKVNLQAHTVHVAKLDTARTAQRDVSDKRARSTSMASPRPCRNPGAPPADVCPSGRS